MRLKRLKRLFGFGAGQEVLFVPGFIIMAMVVMVVDEGMIVQQGLLAPALRSHHHRHVFPRRPWNQALLRTGHGLPLDRHHQPAPARGVRPIVRRLFPRAQAGRAAAWDRQS